MAPRITTPSPTPPTSSPTLRAMTARAAGPSSALAWTKAQRKRVNGLRFSHKNDPPTLNASMLVAASWAQLRALNQTCLANERVNASPPPFKDRVDAIWSSYERATPPDLLVLDDEIMRLSMLEYELRTVLPTGKKPWSFDLLVHLMPVWAGVGGISFVLALAQHAPSFWSHGAVRTDTVSRIEFGSNAASAGTACETKDDVDPPGQLLMAYGNRHAFWVALRRYLFALDECAWAAAVAEGERFRSSLETWENSYRMQLLFDLSYAFGRDPSWASQHVRDLVDPNDDGWRRSIVVSPDLLLPALTDAALANAYIQHFPVWRDRHGFNLPTLLDIVEALGADAAPVLRQIHTSDLRASATKPFEEAIELAES